MQVGVLADEPAGRDDPAAPAVVVVPAGDAGDRHDRLEPGDPGAGDRDRQRAVVALARHRDVPGGPGGLDLLAVRGERLRLAGQPLDHGLHAELLTGADRARATVGIPGAERAGGEHRVPARDEVVVVVAAAAAPRR